MFWSGKVKLRGNWVEGRFLMRENRFRVRVEVAGVPVSAHLPNSGRLSELLVPGCRVLLDERADPGRKTRYDLSLVDLGGSWVSVDSRLPNDLVAEALDQRQLTPLLGYSVVRREVRYGHSRFDFQLAGGGRPPCLLEVKSITLVIDGLGCFPDAVTERGRRHLVELARAAEAGYRSVVLFVVQREDALGVRPHDESDPEFGQALRQAVGRGVEVYAYGCRVEPGWVGIERPVPIHLSGCRCQSL